MKQDLWGPLQTNKLALYFTYNLPSFTWSLHLLLLKGLLLNQVHTGRRLTFIWFLKIGSEWISVCVCVFACVCVRP